MKNILLIGCGHMGNALLRSWLSTKSYNVIVVDNIKYNSLKKKYKNKIYVSKSISLLKSLKKIDCIVLAVKPGDLNNVLNELSVFSFNSNVSLVSIVAGKKIMFLKKKLKNIKNLFRVMPNLPASIGQSMNCIVSNQNVDIIRKNNVFNLFACSGKTLFLKNENQIDMATAISGSGPGFVFNLIDAMEKSAEKLGFNKNISKILVSQTFKGSINLYLNSTSTAKNLVDEVSTKRGTTEAGIKIMNQYKFHKAFEELTKSAYNRAKKQGRMK